VNLAHALLAAGHPDQAVAEYKKVLDIFPDSAELHNSYGNALRAEGHTDEAIQQYTIAIGMDPGWPTPTTILALLYSKRVSRTKPRKPKRNSALPSL